jgi:hypothetical protein
MPLLRVIEILLDRVRVQKSTGEIRELLYDDIPNNVINQGAAAVEAWCVEVMERPLFDFAVAPDGTRRFYVGVHVLTLSPVTLTTTFSNVPITGNWWESP